MKRTPLADVKHWRTSILPAGGAATLHFDGACSPNPGPMGIGYVITEKQEEPGREPRVLVRVGAPVGQGTNNRAEYEALLAGLRHALRLGLWSLTIRSDSLILVNQIAGQWKVRDTVLARLHREAMVLLGLFHAWTVKHVPRTENEAADALSRQIVYEEPDLGPTDMVKGKLRALHSWQAAAILHWWHARGAQSSYILARIFNNLVFHQNVEAIVTGASYRDASFLGGPGYKRVGPYILTETPPLSESCPECLPSHLWPETGYVCRQDPSTPPGEDETPTPTLEYTPGSNHPPYGWND